MQARLGTAMLRRLVADGRRGEPFCAEPKSIRACVRDHADTDLIMLLFTNTHQLGGPRARATGIACHPCRPINIDLAQVWTRAGSRPQLVRQL